MDRRQFLRAGAAATAATVIPATASAAETDVKVQPLGFWTAADPILKTNADKASQEINVILSNGREPDLVQITEINPDGTKRIAYIEVTDVNVEKRTAVHLMTGEANGNVIFSEFQYIEKTVTPPPVMPPMPMETLRPALGKKGKTSPAAEKPTAPVAVPQSVTEKRFSLKFRNLRDVNSQPIAPEITEQNSALFSEGLHSRTVSETYRAAMEYVALARQAVAEKRASPEPQKPEYTTILKISADARKITGSGGRQEVESQLNYDIYTGIRWDNGLVGHFKLVPSGSSSTPDRLSGTFGPYTVNAQGRFIDVGRPRRNNVRFDRFDITRLNDPNHKITVDDFRSGDPTITIDRKGMPRIQEKLSALKKGAGANTAYEHTDVKHTIFVTSAMISTIPDMAQNVLDHPAKIYEKTADPFRMRTTTTRVSAAKTGPTRSDVRIAGHSNSAHTRG